jgi:hypothetical protein
MGISGDINLKLPYNFETKLLMSANFDFYDNDINEKNNSNNLHISLLLQYTYTKSASEITFGAKGTLLHNTNKLYYNPIFKNYAATDLSEELEYDGISAFIKAKLGNCYLRINFNNILGTNFSYLAYYPILKQDFCLSFTWAFPM